MDGLPRKIVEPSWWFHGQETANVNLDFDVFFSSSFAEAECRGDHLFCAWIEGLDVFDTLDPESIDAYMEVMGRTWPIVDPYDGAEYADAQSFIDGCWHDTWTPFEDMGLPRASLIYEGGVKNLCISGADARRIVLRKLPDGPLFTVLPSSRRGVCEAEGISEGADAVTFVVEPSDVPEGFDLWEVRPPRVGMVPAGGPHDSAWRLVEDRIPPSWMTLVERIEDTCAIR